MVNYLVLEIAGKQYIAEPGKNLTVDFLGDVKEHKCDKILMRSSDGKIDFGTPYLKDTVLLEVVGVSKEKIRVATYKAKANYRRVIGSKTLKSIVKLKSK